MHNRLHLLSYLHKDMHCSDGIGTPVQFSFERTKCIPCVPLFALSHMFPVQAYVIEGDYLPAPLNLYNIV